MTVRRLVPGVAVAHRRGVQLRRPLVGSRWGSLSGGQVRTGGRHYRLVVLPPGTDARERWLLRAWQWWPAAAALPALAVAGALSAPIGIPGALGLAAALAVGPHAWLRRSVRRVRRDLCVVHADHIYGPTARADLARCLRLVTLARTVTDAERALDRGELTPVGFQRVWGEVHAEARVLGSHGREPREHRRAA
jgi:uncharacterized protein DUF6611